MRYRWIVCSLSALVACSNGHARFYSESGSAGRAATLPDSDGHAYDEATTGWIVDDAMTEVGGIDTAATTADSVHFQTWVEREQPGVSLRCEDGQITAYLSTAPMVQGEPGSSGGQAVHIALDSAPRC